jgi:acyl carrier protein
MKAMDLEDVTQVLRAAFPKATLRGPVEQLKLGDFAEWDSLGNFNLLLAFEEFYDVRFTPDEMANAQSVAAIIAALQTK